jgi:hypothetical protein
MHRQLFLCSTIIHIGDRRNTSFCEARWMHVAAPKDLTPDMYQLARFKTWNVHYELTNLNWIRNLKEITIAAQLEEFTMLFMVLSTVQLTDQNDEIIWKWKANGKFSLRAAYGCQFHGSMTKFPAPDTWRSLCEPKSKIFSWLVMQNIVPTTDNMLKKPAMQPKLCPLLLHGRNYSSSVRM